MATGTCLPKSSEKRKLFAQTSRAFKTRGSSRKSRSAFERQTASNDGRTLRGKVTNCEVVAVSRLRGQMMDDRVVRCSEVCLEIGFAWTEIATRMLEDVDW